MDAIRDSMELEIVEIQLLGRNFKSDTFLIKKLEDIWIKEFRRRGEDLYNVAGGSSGATALYQTTGYGIRDVHDKIRYLLSHGFSEDEILSYIKVSHGTLRNLVKEATGTTIRLARIYYAGERMLDLIYKEGIYDLDKLATKFRAMDANDIFVTLASIEFPLGNEYLKGWLTTKHLKTRSDSNFRIEDDMTLLYEYLDDLGIKNSRVKEFKKSFHNNWVRKNYIPLLRVYASIVIRDHDTIYGFLHHLGLIPDVYTSPTHDGMHIWELENIVIDLLGYDFDTAKDIY